MLSKLLKVNQMSNLNVLTIGLSKSCNSKIIRATVIKLLFSESVGHDLPEFLVKLHI